MQIVIDISEESYRATCNGCMLPPDVENVVNGIKNGITIPKGHGRIVDLGKLYDDRAESDNPVISLTIDGQYIEAISLDYLEYDLPTLIEEDKSESEV